MDLEGEICWVTNFTLGATALCSQCVPYHIPLCSLTTPHSALSPACEDLVIYVVTALGTLFLHHLHQQALELRHLHCALTSPSRFSVSIIAGANNCYYYQWTFLGPHS